MHIADPLREANAKMNCLFVLLFYFCTDAFAASVDVKTYSGYREYQVTGDKESLDKFEESVRRFEARFQEQFLIKRYSATSLQTLVSPELVAFFDEYVQKLNLRATLIFDDISEIIQQEKAPSLRKKGFSWSAYYDIDDIYGYLQNMSATYPQWTELVVGGESYEGRQIKGLRINTPESRTEGKPAIFIESGIHAREWITPATTTYFINQLLTSDNPDIEALRNQFDWHIFPSVNPDGYHFSFTKDRMWRKTRSKSSNGCYGADPNRNWDYNWLKHGANDNPCDYQVYGGSKPFSEIETRTLSQYISNVENLLGYIAFHADAQMLLLPYSDSKEHNDNYNDLVTIGKTSLDYGYKVNHAKYDGPATAAEVLYKASGGSMDWVRFALGTQLVYTYELRGYYFYWPPALIYQQGDEVTQMMLGLFKEAGNLGYYK
ncbi:zinc carboxypeptidase-like [Cydia fagiglandana]|uniref:zinc carboxypeptidase-like n=1 Tax=Cydia fagiglandana TaxID=1458189 RepID=UPI002FEE10C2